MNASKTASDIYPLSLNKSFPINPEHMNPQDTVPSAVFDTNICLDFFIFHDSISCQLLDAVKNGKLLAITRSDCRDEFLKVLDYPKLALTENDRKQAIASFDSFISVIEPEIKSRFLLPVCTDPDDQKFLETAFDANAQFLFSKDKALLRLARHNRKRGLFRIMSPARWLSEMEKALS